MNEVNIVVDACGLNCPLPILKARKALMAMEQSQVLKVLSTDATSRYDFPVFAEQTGNKLLSWSEASGVFTYYLQKKNEK